MEANRFQKSSSREIKETDETNSPSKSPTLHPEKIHAIPIQQDPSEIVTGLEGASMVAEKVLSKLNQNKKSKDIHDPSAEIQKLEVSSSVSSDKSQQSQSTESKSTKLEGTHNENNITTLDRNITNLYLNVAENENKISELLEDINHNMNKESRNKLIGTIEENINEKYNIIQETYSELRSNKDYDSKKQILDEFSRHVHEYSEMYEIVKLSNQMMQLDKKITLDDRYISELLEKLKNDMGGGNTGREARNKLIGMTTENINEKLNAIEDTYSKFFSSKDYDSKKQILDEYSQYAHEYSEIRRILELSDHIRDLLKKTAPDGKQIKELLEKLKNDMGGGDTGRQFRNKLTGITVEDISKKSSEIKRTCRDFYGNKDYNGKKQAFDEFSQYTHEYSEIRRILELSVQIHEARINFLSDDKIITKLAEELTKAAGSKEARNNLTGIDSEYINNKFKSTKNCFDDFIEKKSYKDKLRAFKEFSKNAAEHTEIRRTLESIRQQFADGTLQPHMQS